jgi:hypothetical protein
MKAFYRTPIVLCVSLTILLLIAGTVVAAENSLPAGVKISTPKVPTVPNNEAQLDLLGTHWELSNFQDQSLIHVDYWTFDNKKNIVSGTGWSLPWQKVSGYNDRIVLHPDKNPLVLVFVNPSSFIGYNEKGLYCIGKLVS